MSATAIRKLWSFFAIFAFTFSVYAFLRTTGRKVDSGHFGIFDLKPSEIPLLALPVEIIGFGIVLWLTRVWIRDVGGTEWAQRFPIFFFDKKEVDPSSRGGRV